MLIGDMYAPGQIRLIEADEPVLPTEPPAGCSGQIIFQPETTCLCGSDLPYFNGWDEWPIERGHSLHEMIGTITATNGRKWQVGDRVLAVPVKQQGLAERFILDENRAIPIATNIPEEHALMAQPLGTVLFAMRKLGSVLDKDIAVVGQGPMGQLFNAVLSNLGARHVIGIDRVESRLSISRKMGATATVCNRGADPIAEVRKILGGKLPEIVVECVGHADQQFHLCIDLCQHDGEILFFGVPQEFMNGLRWRELFFKNLSVHTSVGPDFERDFPLAMRWVQEQRIDVSPIITHRFPLSQLQAGFELFRDRREGVLKVIINFPAKRPS